MTFYDAFMSPLEKAVLAEIRRSIIPAACGEVLEIGYGTGVNFPYYNFDSIKDFSIIDVQTSPAAVTKIAHPVHIYEGRSEKLPFPAESFDTVVETLVFCSVGDVEASVGEVLRVLKHGGRFIFMDHELPEKKVLSSLFSAAEYIWPKLAGGCHLVRKPHEVVEAAGFMTERSGWAGQGVFHWGIASKPAAGNQV